jgi:hypothetical protein
VLAFNLNIHISKREWSGKFIQGFQKVCENKNIEMIISGKKVTQVCETSPAVFFLSFAYLSKRPVTAPGS